MLKSAPRTLGPCSLKLTCQSYCINSTVEMQLHSFSNLFRNDVIRHPMDGPTPPNESPRTRSTGRHSPRTSSTENARRSLIQARSDGYLARVHNLPSKPHSIDFQHYSGAAVGASAPPISHKLKQSHEQFQVPPPTDGGRLAGIDEQRCGVREIMRLASPIDRR